MNKTTLLTTFLVCITWVLQTHTAQALMPKQTLNSIVPSVMDSPVKVTAPMLPMISPPIRVILPRPKR